MQPDIGYKSRTLIEDLLYKRYEAWAIKVGSNFKKTHWYKCKHIPYNEMSIYSRNGLLNAVHSYHPTSEKAMFHMFAVHHIRGELYRGMTELHAISCNTKKELRNKNTRVLPTQYIGKDEYKLGPSVEQHNGFSEMWENIYETCDPFTRRCLHYKFDYDFNMIRSNLEISRLMACSEEHVRQTLLQRFPNSK
jgi:hypothetical protein